MNPTNPNTSIYTGLQSSFQALLAAVEVGENTETLEKKRNDIMSLTDVARQLNILDYERAESLKKLEQLDIQNKIATINQMLELQKLFSDSAIAELSKKLDAIRLGANLLENEISKKVGLLQQENQVLRDRFEIIKAPNEPSQETLHALLKESYLATLRTLSLILTDKTFPIASFFTQLSIVSQISQEKKEEELRKRDPHLVEKDSLSEIYIRLHEIEKSIEIETLFDNREGKSIKKILLLGRAGIGKSTLCQKIAYDWASGVLFKDKFTAIYHLKLRELNAWIIQNPLLGNQNPDQWLSNAISQLCYQGAHAEKIYHELQTHPEKNLLLFDGWDEASLDLTQALKRCLQKDKVHCLLTSRPGVTNEIQGGFDLTVENMGFTHKQIETYAKKFFSHTQCEGLQIFLQNLRAHNNLFTISHIPIQLQILCALWQKGEKEFPNTLTLMFSKIIDQLFKCEEKREKRDPISPFKEKLIYGAIGEIALKGLDSKQLIIPENLIKQALENEKFKDVLVKDVIGTGLLKRCGRGDEMYFIHLTYQEYSIAKYISTLSEKEQCAFVQNYRYKPQFRLVMRMLAGCLWKESSGDVRKLEVFFEWLYRGHADMIGSYQVELVLACLEECRSEKLDEVIWEKYKIAGFVETVLKSETTRECLIQLMTVSRRVFEQVRKVVHEVKEEQLEWFVKILGKLVKREYLLDLSLLCTALNHQDKEVRQVAVYTLREVAAHASRESVLEILKLFQIALNDKDWDVRWSAEKSLRKVIGHVSQESISEILKWLQTALSDKDSDVRKTVAKILGEIAGYVSQESIPEILKWLQTALSDKNSDVSSNAVIALGKVANQKSTPEILKWLQMALSDKDWDVRRATTINFERFAANANRESIPETLKWIQKALSNENSNVREAAQKALKEIAVHAHQESIPEILEWIQKVLNDKQLDISKVRQYAAKAIEELAANAKQESIPAILKWLQTALIVDNIWMRQQAAKALGEVASHASQKFIPEILKLLQMAGNENSSVYLYVNLEKVAANASQKSIPEILWCLETVLSNEKLIARSNAVKGLGKVAAHANQSSIIEILKWLQMALSDKDSDVRRAAAYTLGEVAAYVSQEYISAILKWLQTAQSDKDSKNVRCDAVIALGKVAAHATPESIPETLKWLQMVLSEDSDECIAAAIALGEVVTHVKESIPEILKRLQTALSDKDSNVRQAAAKVIGKVAAHVSQESIQEILKWLQTALSDKDSNVRQVAAKVIGKVAAHVSQESIPEILKWLQTALSDKDWDVREVAAETIGEIATNATQESIHEILKWIQVALSDVEWRVRESAVHSLKEVITHAKQESIPEILKWIQTALSSENLSVRQYATIVLGKIGAHTKESIHEILKLLQIALSDKHKFVREVAAETIGEVATSASQKSIPEILKLLQIALNDKKLKVREAAAEAFNHVDAKVLLPIFTSKSPDYSALKPIIIECFMRQCIPLYLTETNTGCFIQTNETNMYPFKMNQKASMLQLCQEKGQTKSKEKCVVS